MKTFEQLQKTASDWEAPDFGSYLRRNDVVRLGRSDALQESIKASTDGLMGILASYPEERSLDMITRLQVDTLLSGIFGKSLPEVERNRNFYMQAVTGNNLDDKSFLTAFSNSFTSWNRQKDISRMQNRYDAMPDSPARDQLRTQIDDMLMKEAAQRDFTDRNWFSRNMVRSAPVFAQGMEGLMYTLGGAAIGALLAPAAVGSMPMLAQSISSAGVALRAAGTVGGAGIGSVLGSAWNASHNLFETIRGATSLDMMNQVDSEGNPIPDDIRSVMATVSAFAETALEYLVNFPFMNRLFQGARITPAELSRVSYANIAKNYFVGVGKETLEQSGEEGVQRFSDGLFMEAAKILSNRLAGTKFEIGWQELGKVFVDSGREFKDSLFPMGVMSAFGLGVDLAQPMLATSSMKSDANKHFKKDGQTIDARYVNTQGTKPDLSSSQGTDGKTSEKLDPIEVVVHPLTGELRIPDAAQRQTVANLQAQGVSAIQGKVVKLEVVEGGDLSIVHSIALSSGAEVAGDDTVVFADAGEINKAVFTFGKGAFDISQQDDGYVLTFQDSEGAFRKIQFIDSKTAETRNLDTVAADDSYFNETYVPYSGATMTADRYVSTRERKMIEDWLRKSVGRKVSRKNLRPGVESMLILSRATGISTDELIDRKIRLQFATEDEVTQAIKESGKDLSPENVNGWRSVKDSNGNTVYTIHLSKNANPSTIVHETGHILRALATDEQLRSFAEAYKKPMGGMWLSDIKARDGKFYLGDQVFNTEEEAKAVAEKNEERFAEDFVSYLQTGVAPNTEMQGLFARMKEFLKNVYNAFKDQLTSETRKAFDDLLNSGMSQERTAAGALFQTEDTVMSQVEREYADTENRLRENPDNFDADGNHLAPNGKPSNLTYEQWVQVRTPAFKKWFGDWEKNANFNWLMSAEPLVALTGEEFKENLVDSVSAFYGQMGNRVTRDGLGEVTLTRHDVQSSVAHGIGRIKAAAFAAVPDVIQYGREFNQAENYKDRGYTSITIAAPISIRKEQYICEVVINKRDKSNNFYLHEVEVKEKLQFGNQVRNYMDENHPNRNTKTGASRLIISKLLAEGKFESSKVVDVNGEPRVVYHGTANRDEVSTWNPEWKGYDTDYSRFSVFRRKNEGRANSGFFFNSDMDNAGGYGSEMYSCYLNLRNPLTIEANGQNYSSVKFGAMEKDTYDWARYAEKEGYDGVIFNNISDGVGFGDLSIPTNDYVAFKSSQIKSATDNRGTFDGGNPNILFQTATVRMDVPKDADGERHVYDLAYGSQAEFEDTVLDIASAVGLDADSVRFRKSLKGADRARTKVEQDYGGDWARLLDINGATMTFPTFEETEVAFDSLLRSHSDIIVRQKRKATDFGYRDFILNIRMSNGFIGALQLLEDSVFNAKKAGGHKIYNEARKLTEFYENREKYTAIFGSEVCTSIERLHDSLKAWSVEVYSSKGSVYDRPGLSAKASATLRESNELSSMLRPYMPRSLSVGFLSTTDFPSSEGTSTASRNTPPSSVLMGISQISKYLTAIENSYIHNIASDDGTVNSTPLFQLSDAKRQEYLDARKRDVKEAVENYFYVGDGILSEYAGEGWADDEIRFREHLRENPWILEAARKYQDLDEFLEQLQEDEEYDVAEYTWREENDDWAERIWNYSRITTPEISDKQFLRQWVSSDRSLIGLAERLKGYSDIAFNAKGKQFITHKFGAFKGVGRKVLSLTKDSTDAQIAEARTLIEENPRAYRKALQTVSQAEDRILEFRGLAARGEASRDSYYDALGETMEDELLQIDRLNEVAADKEDAKAVAEEQEVPRLTSSQKSLTGESVMRRLESAEAEVRELKKDVKSLSVAEDREKRAKEKYRALYKDYKEEAKGLEALYASTKDTLVAVLDENAGKSEEIKGLKKERQDLANALADRRRRVNDLRTQLTEARDELSKARKSVQAYKRLVEARKLSQARNVLLKKILRRAKFNPNTMDASFEDDFAFIPGLFDKNRSREDILRWSRSMPEHLSENLSRYMGDNGWMFINRPINDWTIGELENLYESVKLMAADSRAMLQERKLAEQAWTQGKMVSYFKEQYGRAPDIEDMERFTKSILHDVNTTIQKYQGGEEGASKKALHGFTGSWMHIQRLARYLDGYDEGAMYQFFVRDLHAAFNEEYKNKNRRLEDGKAVMKELGITEKRLNTPLYTFKTISGNEETLTVDQVMGVYVFAQNDGGASKLFSPAGNSIPWTEYENMVSKLDGQSRAWADWMLAELGGDDNFNRLSAVDYRVNNHNMQREDSYFTFVARGKEVEGTADSFQGAKTVAKRKTDTGMMKSRTGAVYPLDLSVTGIWMREVGRQEHAIALTEWGKRANRLLGPNGVGHMISVNYGETTLATLQSFVNNIIAGQDKLMWYERILNKLLSNASASVLSLNLATPIIQLASFSAVVRGDLDAIRFLQSISPFWGQTHDFKYAMERMRELAPDILNRTFNIEIARYRNFDSHTAAGRALHKVNDWGLKGIEAMDGFVVNRLWAAKFLTEMDKHGNEQEAAFRASQFISETQSSSNMMDLSLMQQSSNPLLRMVAQFNNDAFQHWNMMFGDVPFYWKKRMYGKAIGSIASILLSSVFIIAVSGALLRRKDDDDDEYWKRVRRAIAKTLIADTIPLVGGDISDGMGFGGGDLLQLSESFGGIVYALLGDEDDRKKLSGDMWDVIEESGKVLGVPTVGPSRAIRAVKEQNLYYLFGGSWWRRSDR